jgi:hypothetical protein
MFARGDVSSGALRGAFAKLTRQPILAIFAFLYAPLVGLLGIQYLSSLSGPLSPEGDRVVMGDFLAFQTGAVILADGRGSHLYDLRFQRETQDQLVGKVFPEWQPYVNPPLLAIALRPLAGLETIDAFRFYSAAMACAGLFGAATLVAIVPHLARTSLDAATVFLLSLSFHPLARTLFGGQNAVLTWALLSGVAWAFARRKQVTAGLLFGLLTYKPQYLPLPGLLLAYVGAWPALAVASSVGLLHYALGAAFVGPGWPLAMLAAMRQYRPMEWAGSFESHFSLLPFFDYAVGGAAGRVLASATIVAVLVALWRYAPRARPESVEFSLLWSLVIVAEMLASPHLQYYDFGVLVLPVLVGLERMLARGRPPSLLLRILLGIVYVGYPWLYEVAPRIGFQPLTLCTLAIYAWLCSVARKPAPFDCRTEIEGVAPREPHA